MCWKHSSALLALLVLALSACSVHCRGLMPEALLDDQQPADVSDELEHAGARHLLALSGPLYTRLKNLAAANKISLRKLKVQATNAAAMAANNRNIYYNNLIVIQRLIPPNPITGKRRALLGEDMPQQGAEGIKLKSMLAEVSQLVEQLEHTPKRDLKQATMYIGEFINWIADSYTQQENAAKAILDTAQKSSKRNNDILAALAKARG